MSAAQYRTPRADSSFVRHDEPRAPGGSDRSLFLPGGSERRDLAGEAPNEQGCSPVLFLVLILLKVVATITIVALAAAFLVFAVGFLIIRAAVEALEWLSHG